MNVDSINKFVFGVKGLELWNNMVCWTFRENQNKSSGTTMLTLGGSLATTGPVNGTVNGTLQAGGLSLPPRTTNGVEFSGTIVSKDSWPQNYFQSGSFYFSPSCTLFAVINHNLQGLPVVGYDNNNSPISLSSYGPIIMNVRPSNSNAGYHFPRRIGLNRTSHTPIGAPITARYGVVVSQYFQTGGPPPAPYFGQKSNGNGPVATDDNNNWAVVGMSFRSGFQMISRNGDNFTTLSTPIVPDSIYSNVPENYVMEVGSIQRPVAGFIGTGAAYFYFNKLLSEQEHAKFYTLYKETLGAGLGLP